MSSEQSTPAMERQTICLPHHGTQGVLQRGDTGFKEEIDRLYRAPESNAIEKLIELKANLRTLSTDDFWSAVTEGMSRILGADICFVMKRVLVDDQESAIEMPPIGEPGACIMAAALHYCAHDGSRETMKSTKFHAYGCPCAYMRHDKIFLIPDRLNDFITNNPNQLPTPCEAYIAVPLFAEGKCFAHFGAMWSTEAAARRQLSWAFIEMILHTLEDQISERFLKGSNLVRASTEPTNRSRVIPHDAVAVTQSLRPYAGSLSHELRTPMQGIVGMLDVMYATVEEAVETQTDPRIRKVFEMLKYNIETVQDSSRRAVEAADNVVHAYDMDMSIPDAPPNLADDPNESMSPFSAAPELRPEILVAGSNLPLARPNKRRRDDAFPSRPPSNPTPLKMPKLERVNSSGCRCSHPSENVKEGLKEAENVQAQSQLGAIFAETPALGDAEFVASASISFGRIIAPGLRHTSLRELIQHVINEGLKVGGRPDSVTATEVGCGESIEVRFRGSDGGVGRKIITWNVDASVPSTMFIDEKDLSKLISCVFLNAIKFTDRVDGRVDVTAKMSHRNRYITIRIADNGPGIPAAFLPKLFKPFSQGNPSLTRSSDGLGLGLMVAKGIARKLGGDLMCTRADTDSPSHGTEFEIKVPVHAGEIVSRPVSPFGSPMPRRATVANTEPAHIMPLGPIPRDPRDMSRALHDAVTIAPLDCASVPVGTIATPPSPTSDVEHHKSPASSVIPPEDQLRSKLRVRRNGASREIDRNLAAKYPLNFLVAEDNKINRKLLVNMLNKFGYMNIQEAHDGAEAVRQMSLPRSTKEQIDVVLMDLWMPLMDGYEATERILSMAPDDCALQPTVLAVTADVTDGALERAARVGMKGFMSKPYKLLDLQRLITEYCASHRSSVESLPPMVSISA